MRSSKIVSINLLADIALVRRVKIFGTSTETAYINSLVITPNGEDLYIGGTVGLIAYNVENDELTHPRTSMISHYLNFF